MKSLPVIGVKEHGNKMAASWLIKRKLLREEYVIHTIVFLKFDLKLVIVILFFLCTNDICSISFCLAKKMQTEHIIGLVTQISKKCVLIKLKLIALNACSCPAFLIRKPPSPAPVTEKYTAFKLLLSFQQLVHKRGRRGRIFLRFYF